MSIFSKRYIISVQTKYFQDTTIKSQDILTIVSEISETLSLTNNTKQLLETTLDTLSELLNLKCCWIQLVKLDNPTLPLAACRGFSPSMKREISAINMEHKFSHEIVGLGHRVIIPNLSQDGKYDIPIFEKSGYISLIATPIMTYRVHGILGIAFPSRMKFNKDYADLIAVIANLIGMAINKVMLNKPTKEKPKQPESNATVRTESREKESQAQSEAESTSNKLPMKKTVQPENNYPVRLESHREDIQTQSVAAEPEGTGYSGEKQSDKEKPVKDFHEHVNRMRKFTDTHKRRRKSV